MRATATTLALLLIAAALVIPMLGARVNPKQKPQIDPRTPVNATLSIGGEQGGTFTNTADLLKLLRSERAVQPHDCQMAGEITFSYESSNQWSVYILPGQNATNYEFRCSNGYYAVPRGSFMATLAAAGIDTTSMPTK